MMVNKKMTDKRQRIVADPAREARLNRSLNLFNKTNDQQELSFTGNYQ